MNPLRLLPPETAHKFVLCAVKHKLAPAAAPDDPATRIELFGKTFRNPVGLAAGADKNAEALVGWARLGFGFVEAGTVTRHPRQGNPKPRLWRLGGGHIVNWMGLPNKGMNYFVTQLQRFQSAPERKSLVIGASISSPESSMDDLRALAAAIAPLADYLTINVSCPNVDAHDNSAAALQEQVKAVVDEAGTTPVLIKLAPETDKNTLQKTVQSVLSAGAKGLIATNTMPWSKHGRLGSTPFDWPQSNGTPVGGYSGPLLLDTTRHMVRDLRDIAGTAIPVIGCGGVQSGEDAETLFSAGANAVQIYTGLIYKGAKLIADINRTYCARRQQGHPPA